MVAIKEEKHSRNLDAITTIKCYKKTGQQREWKMKNSSRASVEGLWYRSQLAVTRKVGNTGSDDGNANGKQHLVFKFKQRRVCQPRSGCEFKNKTNNNQPTQRRPSHRTEPSDTTKRNGKTHIRDKDSLLIQKGWTWTKAPAEPSLWKALKGSPHTLL